VHLPAAKAPPAMSSVTPRRILIVGGVAAGASCASRLRRLDEAAEVHVFERGAVVSWANCSLPYRVGNIIKEEKSIILATPELFHNRFNINVHLHCNVRAINRQARTITVEQDGAQRDEPYDYLVLATGARAIQPKLPGADRDGIFFCRSIPDSQLIMRALSEDLGRPAKAVIIGGGFIGMEMAENLKLRGVEVCILEKAGQLMASLDAEMAHPVQHAVEAAGVRVVLGDGVCGFDDPRPGEAGRMVVQSEQGLRLPADLVIMAIGVAPENELAQAAGLQLGARGAVVTDAHMRTSDPHIFAAGDVAETADAVLGVRTNVPLAGPANRQGRLVADNLAAAAGASVPAFRGVQGTSVCGAFGVEMASTGPNSRQLDAHKVPYETVWLHPGHHVSYYPGAARIHMKMMFDPTTGKVLSAQAVGARGVPRRIDVISMAIQMGATVYDLAGSELCYSPQFGAAKDPINLLGFVACNMLTGAVKMASWPALLPRIKEKDSTLKLLDVRTPAEYERHHIDGAVLLPIESMRQALAGGTLPPPLLANPAEPVHVLCAAGQRAYYAHRALEQAGVKSLVVPGGMTTYHMMMRDAGLSAAVWAEMEPGWGCKK